MPPVTSLAVPPRSLARRRNPGIFELAGLCKPNIVFSSFLLVNVPPLELHSNPNMKRDLVGIRPHWHTWTPFPLAYVILVNGVRR